RIAWDHPISRYIGDVSFENESVGAITLRSLATHSSGLPRLPDNLAPEDGLDPYADYAQSDLNSFLGSFDPDNPSTEYAYSNLGLGLLGTIAAEAADLGYPDAIAHYVFEPLGMDRSFASYPEVPEANMASGYSSGAVVPAWNFDALAGAGAIVSSANDLMNFIRASCKGDVTDMHKAIVATQQLQEVDRMALGWHTRSDSDGNTVYWHNGGTGGFASFLAVNPATSQGWLILAASTEYGWLTELGFSRLAAQEESSEAIDLAPFIGVFQLAPSLFLTISEQDGQLFGQATGQGAFPLTHKGGREFEFTAARIEITFKAPADGLSPGMDFVQAGQKIDAPRVEDEHGTKEREEISVDSETLQEYVGEYRLANGVTITVTVRESQLVAQVTNQPAYPVFATARDRFFYKVVDAELEFLRNDSGAVHELVLHQAGEHRAPRRAE
ncbi:MAG: serine hydrolase, partial [Gammaproteobacteria bacterium]|nr:serine hydrolase [Gammaproteobacteria bacterium]